MTQIFALFQAKQEPYIPPYSKIGYVKLQDRTTNEVLSLNEEEDDECPPGECPLPLEYDARRNHMYCPSISEPLDQGCNCRGSWVSTHLGNETRFTRRNSYYFYNAPLNFLMYTFRPNSSTAN